MSVYLCQYTCIYINVLFFFSSLLIYCTNAAKMKMDETEKIETDHLKEKIQAITSVIEATGEQFSLSTLLLHNSIKFSITGSDSNINLKSKDELGVTVADTEAEIRAKKTSSQEDPTILSLRAQVQLLEANIARMSLELEDKERMLVYQHKESQSNLEDNKQTNNSKDYYHNVIYKCTLHVHIYQASHVVSSNCYSSENKQHYEYFLNQEN